MPVQTTAYPTGTIGFLAFPDQFHFLKTELINRFNFSEKKIGEIGLHTQLRYSVEQH